MKDDTTTTPTNNGADKFRPATDTVQGLYPRFGTTTAERMQTSKRNGGPGLTKTVHNSPAWPEDEVGDD